MRPYFIPPASPMRRRGRGLVIEGGISSPATPSPRGRARRRELRQGNRSQPEELAPRLQGNFRTDRASEICAEPQRFLERPGGWTVGEGSRQYALVAEEQRDARELVGMDAVDVIARCLRAWARGPFIEDWEFATVTGLARVEVAEVCDSWPMILNLALTDRAVKSSLGNLLGYPHGVSLEREIGASEADIRSALAKWRDAVTE